MATILGGQDADSLLGGAEDDLILGYGGADSLAGGEGADTLDAGTGADRLDGGAGADRAILDRSAGSAALRVFLLGPGFTSTIDGAEARGIEAFTLLSGTGADSLLGATGDDLLAGGGGEDALTGGAGADTLLGEDGADTLLGGPGADLLDGEDGADRFVLQDAVAAGAGSTLAAMDTIRGFDATDGDLLWLRGQSAAGALLLLDGPGRFALAGQAALPIGFGGSLGPLTLPEAGLALPDPTGGAAFQVFWAPALGDDAAGWLLLDLDRDGVLGTADLVLRVEFATPGDVIDGEAFAPGSFARLGTTGADSILGGPGAETIHGFAGADSLSGDAASDSLAGGDGNDSLLGGAGFDTLRGDIGADTLAGGTDADVLDGGAGADRLAGEAGADLLLGGAGADRLEGGEGDDTLEAAGRGDAAVLLGPDGGDALVGGPGADLFVLQGAGDPSWSRPDAPVLVADFDRSGGDSLRIGTAGAVADAGTLLGADGRARPLVWSNGPSDPVAAPAIGLRLPAQFLPGLDAVQAFWLRDPAAGGWLVLDLDGDGVLGAGDLMTRVDGVDALTPADLLAGSLMQFAGGTAPTGTPGDNALRGTARSEFFQGGAGSDTIDGGAGAPNAISYAGLGGGGIAFSVLADASGYGLVVKPGLTIDLMRSIHGVSGTAAADALDGRRAPAEAVYVLSLEGLAGNDSITGNGSDGVQASYAESPAAVRVDLMAGTASDGWGGTDTLVQVRRVALLSGFDDTVLGSAADEVFLSGAGGSKRIEGGGGLDTYRYAGSGAVAVTLAEEVVGLFRLPPRADKPGGRDTLLGIGVAIGGAGDDTLRGGAAAERFAGGPGNDSIDGGAGDDTVFHDLLSTTAGLAQRGVVLDLMAGTATDPWGGQDSLAGIENAWGTQLADDMTGRAVAGSVTWLRGLAGDDTLRAPAGGVLVTADHATDPAGIVADLALGRVEDGWGGRDRLFGIMALRGSGFADSVLGGSGGDRIEGGAGDDTLDGRLGADTLNGGPGNDLYRIDSTADRIEDAEDGGQDTIETSVALYLPTTVEDLVLLPGAGGIFGVGNGLANRIRGNEAGNLVIAGAGADTLEGGDGVDTLFGQDDADLLAGGAERDWIFGGLGDDRLEGGDGNDVLYGEAEDDLLLGEADSDLLVGGDGADTLTGGAGNDILYGQDGADSSQGGAGIDFFDGGAGNDTLDGEGDPDAVHGGAGDDLVYGGAGFFTDILTGGDGNDTLDGSGPPGSGPRDLGDYDLMNGGPGDDLYIVDTPFDLTFEAEGGGHDVVRADIRGAGYYLWPHADDLILLGSTPFGVGNASANRVIGTDGVNWLLGGDGNDTLEGRGGNDVLFGQAGADLFVFAPGMGVDTVGDFAPAEDRLALTGFGLPGLDALLARARQVGPHIAIDLDGGDQIILHTVLKAQLTEANLILG